MNENKIDIVSVHNDCLKYAEDAFLSAKKARYSFSECMRSAIAMYLITKCKLKRGFETSELPLELMYPDNEDRYIAKSERMRALTIISENFANLPIEDSIEWSEFSLFLAFVQYEIEGPLG